MAYAPYSSDPVADASRYFDALDAEAQSLEAETTRIGNEIHDTLTKHIRVTTNLTLPSITRDNKVSEIPASEVISDEIGFGKPFEALMVALQKSDCLHVAALREAIAQSYINSHAADIAEATT